MKKPYSYRFDLRRKSVIKAVCEVSGLKISEMTTDFHSDSNTVYRKLIRNILVDMLIKNAEMQLSEIEKIVGVSLGQVSNIANRETTLMEKNIRTEIFERYCQLMFQGVTVCEFFECRRVFKYRSKEPRNFDVIEVLPQINLTN